MNFALNNKVVDNKPHCQVTGSTLQFYQTSSHVITNPDPMSTELVVADQRLGDHIPSSDTEKNPTQNPPFDTRSNHLPTSNLLNTDH